MMSSTYGKTTFQYAYSNTKVTADKIYSRLKKENSSSSFCNYFTFAIKDGNYSILCLWKFSANGYNCL